MNPDVKIDGSESSLTGPLRRAMNAALINVMDLKVNGNPEKIPLAEILGNMDALASALHAADPGRERGPCGSYPGTALHVESSEDAEGDLCFRSTDDALGNRARYRLPFR